MKNVDQSRRVYLVRRIGFRFDYKKKYIAIFTNTFSWGFKLKWNFAERSEERFSGVNCILSIMLVRCGCQTVGHYRIYSNFVIINFIVTLLVKSSYGLTKLCCIPGRSRHKTKSECEHPHAYRHRTRLLEGICIQT